MLKKDMSVVKHALMDGLTTKAVWDAYDRIKKFVEEAQNTSTNTQQLKAKLSEFRESLEWYRDNIDRGYANGFLNKLDGIQKLSAV